MENVQPLQKFKIPLIISAAIVILILVVFFLFREEAVLSIQSEEGAEIAIATEQEGEYKKIGTTKANYRTTKLPQTVYIQATKGHKKTISSILLTEKKQVNRHLSFADRAEAESISEGAFSHLFIDNNLVQGIFAQDYRIMSFKTDEMSTPRSDFIKVPQLKKIIWKDKDNFIYNSFRAGVGRFINGSLIGSSGLAQTVTDKTGNPIEQLEDDHDFGLGALFIDIAQYPGKPVVFLTKDALYVSSDLGSSVRKIAEFEAQNAGHQVFADDNYIYRFSGLLPADYASETTDTAKNENSHQHFGLLLQYDYDGNIVREIEVPYESLISVSGTKNTTIIVGREGILSVTGETIHELPAYTMYTKDSMVYNDELLVLSDSSLWKVGDNGTSLQEILHFPEYGIGVENSLGLTQNGKIVFSTNKRPGDTSTKNMIFELSL